MLGYQKSAPGLTPFSAQWFCWSMEVGTFRSDNSL